MGTRFQEHRMFSDLRGSRKIQFQKFQSYTNDPCAQNSKFLRVGVPMTEEALDLNSDDGKKSVLAMCKHNATHFYPVNEIKQHELDCPDGVSYDEMLKKYNEHTIVPKQEPKPRVHRQGNNRYHKNKNNYQNQGRPNQHNNYPNQSRPNQDN